MRRDGVPRLRDLVRSLHQKGKPVTVPWTGLGAYVKPRTGTLMAVAAAAGVGKSNFALDFAAHLAAPTLYVSLDTTLVDQGLRLTAKSTGQTIDEIQMGHDTDLEGWIERWEPVVENLGYPIRFVDISAGAKAIGEMVAAEAEYLGEPPLLTIVDNVSDLVEGEESGQEFARIFRELNHVAKEQNTFVMGLHHIRRKPPGNKRPCKKCGYGEDERDQGTEPVHMSDILYGGDRAVQYLLGLWAPSPGKLRVGVLKNRMGPSNPNGGLYVTLHADLARSRLEEDLGWAS